MDEGGRNEDSSADMLAVEKDVLLPFALQPSSRD
jgi:hypothetical protein